MRRVRWLSLLPGHRLRRRRRAVARERVLSELGSELLRATDPAAIHRAAAERG